MRSLTVGMGQSMSSFLLVVGDSWDRMYGDSGVVFPKEGVFTEWIYGWASAHKMSANMLTACVGCGLAPKAVAIDAVYASVSRSTLDSHGKENLFSVCILRCLFGLDSNRLNCDRFMGLLICSSFCRIVQRHTRQQNAGPGVSEWVPVAHRRQQRSVISDFPPGIVRPRVTIADGTRP